MGGKVGEVGWKRESGEDERVEETWGVGEG